MDINNNIKEDYCSFGVSKLLKEKRFEIPIKTYFRATGSGIFEYSYSYNSNDDEKMRTAGGMTYISAPTHSLALKWLRDNFNIHIEVRIMPSSNIHGLRKKGFEKIYQYWIQNLNEKRWNDGETCSSEFNSYEEATEAALLYVLKELI